MAKELKVDDLVQAGKHGVTNKQMIPAIQAAITEPEETAIQKLKLLRQSYVYVFDKSVRYLKKHEREFIEKHILEEATSQN